MVTSCTCPGYEAVYECTVAGGGATFWLGTALEECTGGRIILRHSQFESGYNINQTCGASGPVVGHAVSVLNDSYTSQLTINVSQNLTGSTIECASDSGTQVGTIQILPTTGMFCSLTNIIHAVIIFSTARLPLLSDIMLSNVTRNQLTFTWNPASQDCSALQYSINATNCGKCSDTTTSSSVTCNYNALSISTLPQICTLTVHTVVCGNIVGATSEPATVLLKGWLHTFFHYLRIVLHI